MYTFTEAIAIIFSLSVLIKFSIFFLGNTPTKILISNTKKVYENKMLRALYFLLFFVTFYLVSTELSIIQIVAGITVGLFLYGHMLMHFPKEMTKIAAKFYKDKNKWFPEMIVYMILAIWVLVEIFA